MDNMKISAILYSIVAIIFILCAATGGSPAFYGVAAAFIALAAALYPKKDKKDCEQNGSTECVIVYGSFYARKSRQYTCFPAKAVISRSVLQDQIFSSSWKD